jgi:uncharacterized protein
MMTITTLDIEQMTKSEGEAWAYPHVRRVLELGARIAGELDYQPEWFWLAAYLHDWGAFPRYRKPGYDHALRSREIAETEILPHCNLPAEAIARILEAIEYHDYHDQRPVTCPEAVLLREADYLDFLGPLGVARELAVVANDIPKAIARVHMRMDLIRGRFTLPAAREISERRLAEMEALIHRFEQESFGFL